MRFKSELHAVYHLVETAAFIEIVASAVPMKDWWMIKYGLKSKTIGRTSCDHTSQRMRFAALAIGLGFGTTVAAATNFITAPNHDLATGEDTALPLNLSVEPGVLNGGRSPNLIGTATGFRANDAGATPFITSIPADALGISITGYSTQPADTGENDELNDEYQLLNVQVDLVNGVSSGQVSLPQEPVEDNLDQYSWINVPLGQPVLTDPTQVVGNSDLGVANPTIDVIGNDLYITETHTLETAYLVEYLSTQGSSSNFVRTDSAVQSPGDTTSKLTIPNVLEPVSGVNGFINLNTANISVGENSQQEHKGVGRVVIDLESNLISGTIFAEQGETEDNTVTYAFENYPLVDLRVGGTVSSVLSSGASIVGDTTSLPSVRDDLTIYIDAAGELVIEPVSYTHLTLPTKA